MHGAWPVLGIPWGPGGDVAQPQTAIKEKLLREQNQFGAGEHRLIRKHSPQGAPGNDPLLKAISRAAAVQGTRRCKGGQGPHWDPGSEERMPDFRAFGGGGGGALASLRTGSGGATSVEVLWLLLGGGGGGREVTSPSVCKDGELRVLVALGVSGGGLRGVD